MMPEPALHLRPPINVFAVGSVALLLGVVGGTAWAFWQWRDDPLTRRLVLLFLGATLAVAGAVAGIVLVPLGLSRGRRARWVAGLVAGGVSFAVMGAAVVWAVGG